MRRTTLLFAMLVASSSAFAEVKKFGEPLNNKAKTMTVAEVVAKADAGTTVRLEGSIAKVCENQGCWLELKDGDTSVRVTFADHAFFVPKDSSSVRCTLEGTVKVNLPNPANVTRVENASADNRGVSIEAIGLEVELKSESARVQTPPSEG